MVVIKLVEIAEVQQLKSTKNATLRTKYSSVYIPSHLFYFVPKLLTLLSASLDQN